MRSLAYVLVIALPVAGVILLLAAVKRRSRWAPTQAALGLTALLFTGAGIVAYSAAVCEEACGSTPQIRNILLGAACIAAITTVVLALHQQSRTR